MAYPAGTPNAIAVTPSDTVPVVSRDGVAHPISGFYVGATGGAVVVITPGGQTVTFAGTVVGSTIWVKATHIKATGTAATSLVAFY
jgi:hypothetical protein